MTRSRIKYHLKQQSSRNIFFALGGIITIFILLAVFGMDFLVNFSLFVKKSTGGNNLQENNLTYVAPPVINPLTEATKSATIVVSGYAGEKQTVKLYVNDKFTDKVQVKKNNQFVFSNVELKTGNNEIKVKAQIDNDNESNYSNTLTITYIDEPPSLEISNPSDGQTVSKGDGPLKITGKTNPGVKVTINDFWTITEDDGSFSYSLSLHDGDNTIKIVATDNAGNSTVKELTIKTN